MLVLGSSSPSWRVAHCFQNLPKSQVESLNQSYDQIAMMGVLLFFLLVGGPLTLLSLVLGETLGGHFLGLGLLLVFLVGVIDFFLPFAFGDNLGDWCFLGTILLPATLALTLDADAGWELSTLMASSSFSGIFPRPYLFIRLCKLSCYLRRLFSTALTSMTLRVPRFPSVTLLWSNPLMVCICASISTFSRLPSGRPVSASLRGI